MATTNPLLPVSTRQRATTGAGVGTTTGARQGRRHGRAARAAMIAAGAAVLGVGAGANVAAAAGVYGGSGKTRATATMINADGNKIGTAQLRNKGGTLSIAVALKGVAPGWHGLHLHAVGKCTAPDFKDAGGHWNPAAMKHGEPGKAMSHMGDLPMVWADEKGRVRMTVTVPARPLAGGDAPLLDADGAAIVLHAAVDDYRTDPSGNSGARIACGVIR